VTKPRCGADLPPSKDPRRKYDTCRHIVKEGNRCHRHQYRNLREEDSNG
jgi:hypothetical protein